MRYQLAPICTRQWLLNGFSLRLIESHYENHYGGEQVSLGPVRADAAIAGRAAGIAGFLLNS